MNPLGSGMTLMKLLESILDFVIQIGVIVIIFMVVYVGFLFVKAQGNPGEIESARRALLWTVVGALILLGSKAIALGLQETVKALSVGK
jgi:heme/copper-type cytochrome/quinol oxidase subunit 2